MPAGGDPGDLLPELGKLIGCGIVVVMVGMVALGVFIGTFF